MSGPIGNIFNDDNSSLDNGTSTDQDDSNGQAQGNYNPAFQPLLNDVPQDLHDKIIPHLNKWDQNFQKVQQGYAPWKPILDMGVTPDTVQAGLNLVSMLENNPEALYKALVDYYKFGENKDVPSQGQITENQNNTEDDPYKDRFDQMERGFNTLAEHVLQQRQQEENAKADATLDQEFQAAKQKHGDFDEEWVIAKCMANSDLSIDSAAQMYQKWYQGQMAKFGAKPLIMGGGGGGLPQNNVDVTKLSGKDTRSLVAQMIEHAKQQSRG